MDTLYRRWWVIAPGGTLMVEGTGSFDGQGIRVAIR